MPCYRDGSKKWDHVFLHFVLKNLFFKIYFIKSNSNHQLYLKSMVKKIESSAFNFTYGVVPILKSSVIIIIIIIWLGLTWWKFQINNNYVKYFSSLMMSNQEEKIVRELRFKIANNSNIWRFYNILSFYHL